jgi:hypothetical protein
MFKIVFVCKVCKHMLISPKIRTLNLLDIFKYLIYHGTCTTECIKVTTLSYLGFRIPSYKLSTKFTDGNMPAGPL